MCKWGLGVVLTLLAVCFCVYSLQALTSEWSLTKQTFEKTVYENDRGGLVEVAITVVDITRYEDVWVEIDEKEGGVFQARSVPGCTGAFAHFVGCVTKVLVGLYWEEPNEFWDEAKREYVAYYPRATVTVSINYLGKCEEEGEEDEEDEVGWLPDELPDGLTVVAAAGDMVRVIITQWLHQSEATKLLDCVDLGSAGCYSTLVPAIAGVTFPFDLFKWCASMSQGSAVLLTDLAGNLVSGCASVDDVYIRVRDPDHAGDTELDSAVVIGGVRFNLIPAAGATPDTFITSPISLSSLGFDLGDLVTIHYTDPADPTDVAELTIPICVQEK